jgi:Protein of unknown function (DUF2946)
MKWFRSNISRVSQLALFALAIQFALSFDHVHAVIPQAASATQSGSLSSDVSLPGGLTGNVAVSSTTRQSTPDGGSDEHPGDICAICVTMAMVNSALFTVPPVLVLPQAAEFSYLAPDADLVHVAAVSAGFQPRAPPIS